VTAFAFLVLWIYSIGAMDNPLESVLTLAERAYMRMQVGEVLRRCLEESSSAPMQVLVEGLVLAGPKSLDALRESLAEVGRRKIQLHGDVNQVLADMQRSFLSYGVRLPRLRTALSVLRFRPTRLLNILQEQGVIEDESRQACLQLLHDSRDLLRNLASRVGLLEEVEKYLRDWLLGVTYQSARQEAHEDVPAL
jgi:hypothetical protein